MMKRTVLETYCRPMVLMTVLIMAISGCTMLPEKGNLPPPGSTAENRGFTETWWNYYKRALTYSERRSYPSAIRDLHQAIELNDFDQWCAATPDNEVIDYFPHRELGIILLRKKEYEKAIEQLEYSIESEESAKALFFLDMARSDKIIRYGLDRSPPQIFLQSSTAEEITQAFAKQLKGLAEDDTFVSSISVNDHLIPLIPAPKKYIFTDVVPLQEGENTITASATDLSGKTGKTEIKVIGDHQGPVIEILSATVAEKMYSISGRVSDKGGLASLHINGHLWPITGTFGVYNFTFTQQSGDMKINARDRAGNVTEILLNSDDFDNRSEAVSAAPDKQPEKSNNQPFIRIEGIPDELETYEDSIVFRVKISDTDGIHSLFINTLPVFMTSGKKIYFTFKKHLIPGPNELYFVAFDTRGNKTIRKVTVTRKVDNIFSPDVRMRIAILPFPIKGNLKIQPQFISEALSGILHDRQRFRSAGRQESQLFKRGVGRPGVQVSANHPDVDAFLTGSIHISSGYAEITGQLLDPQNSGIMAFNDVFGKVEEAADIVPLLDELLSKFSSDFPVVQGQVTDTAGGKVTIDLGAKDGIRKHARFIVYRESAPIIHPVLKTVIQTDPDIIGLLQVTAVGDHSSQTRIIEGNADIRNFDKVIAR